MLTIKHELPKSNVIHTTIAELVDLYIDCKLGSLPNYAHTFMGKVGTLKAGLFMISNAGIVSLSYNDDPEKDRCGHRFFPWVDHKGEKNEVKVRIDYFVDLDIFVTRRK